MSMLVAFLGQILLQGCFFSHRVASPVVYHAGQGCVTTWDQH